MSHSSRLFLSAWLILEDGERAGAVSTVIVEEMLDLLEVDDLVETLESMW